MNYQIKAKTGVSDFTIGTQLFTQDLIDLVSCKCIGVDNGGFYDAARNGEFEILKKGEIMPNPQMIVSELIQFSLNKEDFFSLQLDWLHKKEIDLMEVENAVEMVALLYLPKKEAGRIYVTKKENQLVHKVQTGVVTSDDAFDVDEATKDALAKLNRGHWISAIKYINQSVVAGGYTQAIKDEYITEIQAYIDANY